MRTPIKFLVLFIVLSPVWAQDNIKEPQKLFVYYAETMSNLAKRDHEQALTYIDSALAIAPHYPPIRYLKARILELSGNSLLAAGELQLLIGQKQQLVKRMQEDTVFQDIEKYKDVLQNLKSLEDTLARSEFYVRLKEKDLVPEGIAFDPVEKAIYLSSIYKRKIVKIDSLQNVSDFIPTAKEGLLSTLGMEIDPLRRHLWVCSSYNSSNEIIDGEGLAEQAAIFKFDLITQKVIKKYTLQDTLTHFFNDITVMEDGDVYFTDSAIGTAYFIDDSDEILPLFDKNFLISANGITKDDKNENLFISSWVRGIIKYNIASRKWNWLTTDDPLANLSGADGLAYYKGSLIVNSPLEARGIIQFTLSTTGDRVTKTTFLEFGNKLFGDPTTGEITGDEFYYIADAGLAAYDRSTGKLHKEKLEYPVILKIILN